MGGPGRFGPSRKKEAAPNLAGQLLIGYSIAIVIRNEVMLLQAESRHNSWSTTSQLPCQILPREASAACGFVLTRHSYKARIGATLARSRQTGQTDLSRPVEPLGFR